MYGLAADLDEVARTRVHAQARLGREPAVVLLDQPVHVAEVPALGDRPPRGRVVAVLLVGGGERLEVLLGVSLDLAQPHHVRQRPAERGEVPVGLGAEVAQPAA